MKVEASKVNIVRLKNSNSNSNSNGNGNGNGNGKMNGKNVPARKIPCRKAALDF